MKTIDSINKVAQTDSFLLANFPHFDAAPETDTSELVAILECNPEPIVVYVNGEKSWLQVPISAWVAIAIFVIGWLLTRIFKRIDDCNKRKQYSNSVLDWIDLMEPAENNLIVAVKKLSRKINSSKDLRPVAFPMPNTIPDKIKDLSVETMMDVFGRGDYKIARNRHLYNVIGQFDYLTKMNMEIRKEYERYNGQAITLCNEWNQIFSSFANSLEQNQNAEIKRVFIQWMNELEKKPNNSVIHLKYLDEIDNLTKEPNYAISEMKRIIIQSQANHKGFAKLFNQMAARMSESINALKEAAVFFREHPEKTSWFCK